MSSIRLATAANVRALHELSNALNTGDATFAEQINAEELEDEIGRFRVWSGNLGALQQGHSSLDYRLRDSPLLSSNALRFLKELEDNTKEALAVVAGYRLPYELQQKFDDSKPHPDEDDDFFDDDDDDEDEDSTRTELSARFAEIVDIIDNLYTLSVRIRTPTIRSRSLRAATYQPKDPETGVDLLGVYAKHDLDHIQELLSHLRQPHLSSDEGTEHDYLITRLSAAITLRRRQFKYWKRHRDKLGSTILEEQPELPLPLTRPDPPQRNDTLEAQPGTPGIVPKEAPSHKTGKTLLSGTEATQHHQSLDEILDSKSVTSYAVTVKDMHGKGVELPPPPRAADGEKDFECPYCYIICPARYGRGRAWRTHLLQDIQPYVCTLPDCDSSEQLFRSRREWVEHEASHRKAWRCPEHPNAVYKTSAGLEDHLRREHGDSFPASQLPAIIKVGETTTVDLRSTCPICCVHVDTEGLGDFHNHIANHLERIATFALPSGMEEDSDGASSEASRGRSDSRSSRNISDLSFETDSNADSVPADEGSDGTMQQEHMESNMPASVLLSAQAISELPDGRQSRLDTLLQGHRTADDDDVPLKIDTTVDHEKQRLRDGHILNALDVPNLRSMYRSRQLLQRDQSFAPNDSYNRIISFCYHDLTRIRVDGIVNSVARVVRMTSGDTLNNAVHRAAGPSIAKEAKSLGQPTPKHAIVTDGYALPSKKVIHTLRPRSENNFNQLVECYQSAFKAAISNGMKSIAFPCIGTGGIGFSPRVAARLALEESRKILDASPDHGFERIIFCVNTAIDEQAYVDFLPVYFPPTHGDLDEARSSVWSEDRSTLATKVLDTQNLIMDVLKGLDSATSLSVLGFPDVVLRDIDTALASIRKVLLWSQEVTKNIPDVKLICSVMHSFCGNITETIELAKDHADIGQPSDDSIWGDYASDFRIRHGLGIPQLLIFCKEFVVSLVSLVTGRSNVVEQMTTLRQQLERYKARASKSGQGLDHLNEVLYTREFQRETITHTTRGTVKLHQIPSVSQLYKLGELEEKLTMAHPSAIFNDCVCFAREDLTSMEVDVIVNSTDVLFGGIGTLNRSVLKKGGIELQNAVYEFGLCSIGDLKITKGYALPAKHIIHVVPPDQLDTPSKDILRKLYREALHAAVKLRATSLAIPSIGTGMLNYPRRESAAIALEEVKRFLETTEPNNLLEKIVFVAYSSDDEFIYKSAIPIYFPPIDMNANRGYPPQSAEASDPRKRTLYNSVAEAFRSVRFGKLPATSRSITAYEEHALINFESHARTCDTCKNIEKLYLEGRDLCGDGYVFAQKVLWHMSMQIDQTIQSNPDRYGKSVRLDVPVELFPMCTTLLATIERSYRDAGRGRPFVSPVRDFSAITQDQKAASSMDIETVQESTEATSKRARAHILAHSQVNNQWELVFRVECDVRIYSSTIDILSPVSGESLMILRLDHASSVERHNTAPEVLLSGAVILEAQKYPEGTLMFRCPTDSECSSLLRIIRRAIEALQTTHNSDDDQDESNEVSLGTRILETLRTDLTERPGSYIGQSTDRIITTLHAPIEEVLPELADMKAKGAVHNTIDDNTWVVSDPPKDLPVLSDAQRRASQTRDPPSAEPTRFSSYEMPLSNLALWILSYMPQEVIADGEVASHENIARITAARLDSPTTENIEHALTELRLRTKSYSISGTLMGPQLHPDYLVSDNRNASDDWTCIHRSIVDPQILKESGIDFEDKHTYVVLRRSLQRGELLDWAIRTRNVKQLQPSESVHLPLKQEAQGRPATGEALVAPVATTEKSAGSSAISLTSKKVLAYLLEDPRKSFRGSYRPDEIAAMIKKSEDEVSPALHELERMGKVHVVGNDLANWWAATTEANPGRTTDQEEQQASATIRDPPAFNDTPPSPIIGTSSTSTTDIGTIDTESLYIQPSPSNSQWTRIDKALVDPRVLMEADEAFYNMGDHLEVHRVLRRGEIERWADASLAIREKDKGGRRSGKSRRDEDHERLDRVIAGDMEEKELRRFRDEDER